MESIKKIVKLAILLASAISMSLFGKNQERPATEDLQSIAKHYRTILSYNLTNKKWVRNIYHARLLVDIEVSKNIDADNDSLLYPTYCAYKSLMELGYLTDRDKNSIEEILSKKRDTAKKKLDTKTPSVDLLKTPEDVLEALKDLLQSSINKKPNILLSSNSFDFPVILYKSFKRFVWAFLHAICIIITGSFIYALVTYKISGNFSFTLNFSAFIMIFLFLSAFSGYYHYVSRWGLVAFTEQGLVVPDFMESGQLWSVYVVLNGLFYPINYFSIVNALFHEKIPYKNITRVVFINSVGIRHGNKEDQINIDKVVIEVHAKVNEEEIVYRLSAWPDWLFSMKKLAMKSYLRFFELCLLQNIPTEVKFDSFHSVSNFKYTDLSV